MESEKEPEIRPLRVVGRIVGGIFFVLAQTFVLFLVVPVLVIKGVAHLDLAEWLTTTLTAFGVFGYLYALMQWVLRMSARLDGPTARARYRRRD